MMDNKRYSVVSLFSGIGGLDYGFERVGFNVLWACDISRNATNSYNHNFGLKPICCDLAEISINDIPNANIIIGGPPCQSFSLVGKRDPNDNRGKLVFLFLNIIKQKLPEYFVLENVPGMAASKINNVRLTDILLSEFQQLGYCVTSYKLTATDYLVPQKRQRIFIIGSKRYYIQKPDPQIYAKECFNIDLNKYDLSAKAAIGDLGRCTTKGERAEYNGKPISDFARIMRTMSTDSVALHECPRMSEKDSEIIVHIPPGGNYMDIPDNIAPARALKFKKTGGRTTTYSRLHPEKPAYTINTYFRRPNVGANFHYSEDRLITPREAMRFQSIPDHFELYFNSQDERNAFIGNAVPPLLSYAIAWNLMRYIEGKAEQYVQKEQFIQLSNVTRQF